MDRDSSATATVDRVARTPPWGEPERRRLVGLCAVLSGDRDAAEDLAQETLLEAWRNAHKLHDPAGVDRWLAAIARNVCRRWARSRGRDTAVAAAVEAEAHSADALDLEEKLERAELEDLLDRALARVPADTRAALVGRYVHDWPHAEIAARLGVSEDAVSMRVSRGKAAVRQVLADELRGEAAAYGLAEEATDGWRETRVWCSECGRRRLLVRRDATPGEVSFQCPGCIRDPAVPGSRFELANPSFARLLGDLVRPAAMIARVAEWSHRYFVAGAETGLVPCTRCGRTVPLRTFTRAPGDGEPLERRGVFAHCTACGEAVSSSVSALAMSLPEARRLRREHGRLEALAPRHVESGGVPAVVVGYRDLRGHAGVEAVFARDTLRLLAVHDAAA